VKITIGILWGLKRHCTLAGLAAVLQKVLSFSIVKPIKCTRFSNLFYFGITLYIFRTVFFSTISYLLASKQVADDGGKDLPKYVECYSKIKQV